MFEKIKKYYNSKLWDINRVWNVVGKALTEEEYKGITGFEYPDKEWYAKSMHRWISRNHRNTKQDDSWVTKWKPGKREHDKRVNEWV